MAYPSKVCGLAFKKCPSQKWGYCPEGQTRPSIGPREVEDPILPGIKGLFRVSYSIQDSKQIYSVVCAFRNPVSQTDTCSVL